MRIVLLSILLPVLLCSFQISARAAKAPGPFVIYSADSTSHVRFRFASQLLMIYNDQDQGLDAERETNLSMESRRLRFAMTGSVADPRFTFRLQLSTNPKSLELMDLHFDWRFSEKLRLRAGQHKTPFTRYRIQSFQRLTFVDWAIVTKYFGSERQMGFALHNGYEKPGRWGYVLGVFSGENARKSHAVGLPVTYGIDLVNRSDLADSGPTAKFHPEMFLHLSHNSGGIEMSSDTDALGTGLSGGPCSSGCT